MGLCGGVKTGADGENGKDKCGIVPPEERKCRDVLCLLLFVIFWIGMAAVAIVGLKLGNPDRLIYATDNSNKICGVDRQGKNLISYPRLADDIFDAYKKSATIDLTKVKFYGVCVHSCPMFGDVVCNEEYTACWTTFMNTTNIFNRCLPAASDDETADAPVCINPRGADPYCTPQVAAAGKNCTVCKVRSQKITRVEISETQPNPLVDQFQGGVQIISRWVMDLKKTFPLILGVGVGGAFAIALVLTLMMQFIAGFMVWFCTFTTLALSFFLSLVLALKAGILNQDNKYLAVLLAKTNTSLPPSVSIVSGTNSIFYEIAAYVSIVVTAVLFVAIVAFYKRIAIGIGIIKEAARCVKAIPSLVLWPIIPITLTVGLVVYWFTIAAYVATADDFTAADAAAVVPISTNDTHIDVTQLPDTAINKYLLAYHFFGLLWTNQLIEAISTCTISGAVCAYYWTRPDSSGHRDVGIKSVGRAFWFSLRYHIGSLCFGSLIVAIIQFIRAILAYIDSQTQNLQQSNVLIKIAMKVVQCCMWCFEKILKFVTKNAYIIVAMKGTSFCSSTRKAFSLIFANLARIATVSIISLFLLLLSKICVAMGCGVIVYMIVTKDPIYSFGQEKQLSNPMIPLGFTLIIAYTVGSVVLGIFEMAIDTILLCFCEDALINKGGNVYMSPELASYIGEHSGSADKDAKPPEAGKIEAAPSQAPVKMNETKKENIAWGQE